MHIVDYFVIAGYFALVMYLGYYSMKKVSSFDDYAVAGRSMPLPIFFAAIAATLCGGGATIGRISFMHTTGIIVFFALTGVVINQIFSGLFISGRVHNAGKNVYSLGDLYGIYYGRSGRLLSSVFGFLFCVGAFGVQILAMGAILQTATGISLIPAALIASIVTLAYTWSGGILAVTLTDAVQYVIIVIGVTLCAYLAIDHLGGFDAMMSILYSNPRFETNMKPLANWSLVQFLGLFFSFLLGEFCAPYYIQRYASTKSAKDSKNGLLIFGVHWIFFMATTAAIGLASMAIQPDVKPDLAFTNLIRDILPPGITGLVFGALLAAVMSTGAAMINTSAVIYTRDIYNKFINTAATQADLLRQSRLSTLVVGGISIGVAIIFQDVFGLMIYMFKLWPSAILPLDVRPALGQDLPLRGRSSRHRGRLELLPVERQGAWGTLRHPRQLHRHRHELSRTVLRPSEDEGPQARRPLPPRPQLTAGGVIMWLQLTKYLFYLSFFLNIVCGVWVFFGIIQWLRDLNKQ